MLKVRGAAYRLNDRITDVSSSMRGFERLGRSIRWIFGYSRMDVLEQSTSRVEVKHGRTVTSFDRASEHIRRNLKLAGSFSAIRHVELHRPINPAGPPHWFVTVHLTGARQVEVGQSWLEEEASSIAAAIGTVVDRPVRVGAIG